MAAKKSQVWSHFTDLGEGKVDCIYCNQTLSVKNKSTSTLIRHMAIKHPTEPINRGTAGEPPLKRIKENVEPSSASNVDMKPKKSVVWSHFTNEVEQKVKCIYCKQTLSVKNKSTSTLIRHMTLQHPTTSISETAKELPLESIERNVEPSSASGVDVAPKKSFVWNYFTNEVEGKVECIYCDETLSVENNSTSTLIQHMTHKHPTESIIETAEEPPLESIEENVETLSASSVEVAPKKSVVWRHFTDEVEGKVKCLYCTQTLSVKNKSTSTLIRHMAKKHPKQPISSQTAEEPPFKSFEENVEPSSASTDDMAPKKSMVWSHFTNEMEGKVECIYCDETLSVENNSTSTLIQHMTHKHPTESISSETAEEPPLESIEENVETLSASSVEVAPKKSVVWRHFTDEVERKVKCLYCTQTLSVKNKSTSTLIRHMANKHPKQPIGSQTAEEPPFESIEENVETLSASSVEVTPKKSAVWRHFTDEVKGQVKCLYCAQTLSVKNKSTFTLIRHMANKHPKQPIASQTAEEPPFESTEENVETLSASSVEVTPKKSVAWRHFTDEVKGQVKCLYCAQTLSVKNKSTSTLIRHMAHKHPTQPIGTKTAPESSPIEIENEESSSGSSVGPTMASEQFSLCWDNFHKNMSSGMNSLLESEDLVDVTLAVQGKCLKAHKMVLSVCSPYFKELFKSNPCQHPIVFMKDVSYEALSDLLQFMYQGEVQVSQENLTTFIKTAEALQIKGLTADGNGSADNETPETPEKPQRHVEEYKPMPRPKKQPAPAVAPSPPVKRSRLSTDTQSTASVAATPITKQEPSASASIGSSNVTQPEQVHFKMEPYDQSGGMLDETGDETFGDDALDDTAVDDTEDYSMMEGGVGESDGGEPQAGTSGADGTGEGQDLQYLLETTKGLSDNGIVVGGFTYHQNITKGKSGTRYLICAEYKRLICKARAIIPPGGTAENLVLKKHHNHPPTKEVMVKKTFVQTLKKLIVDKTDLHLKDIYDLAVEWYPEGAEVCPFTKMHSSMRRWRAFVYKAQAREQMQKQARGGEENTCVL